MAGDTPPSWVATWIQLFNLLMASGYDALDAASGARRAQRDDIPDPEFDQWTSSTLIRTNAAGVLEAAPAAGYAPNHVFEAGIFRPIVVSQQINRLVG